MPKYMKKSPSNVKHVSINVPGNNNNRNSSQNAISKEKISRKNTTDQGTPLKRSFDFSAVASDILGKKGQSVIKSGFSGGLSKSQNKVKIIIKK
jgi:hypothetical protein